MMKTTLRTLLGKQFAATALVVLLALVIIFHLMVLFGLVPYDLVWGGSIEDPSKMLVLEILSLSVNVLMLLAILVKAGYVRIKVDKNILQTSLWIMFLLFMLNTLGNVASDNKVEKIIFAPLTFLMAVFTLRLAVDQQRAD